MEADFEMMKALNKETCETATIEEWAAWYEGEESWGGSTDGDDDN